MIIQCEKCQTRFRLDDSRVTDKGVKVRCTKCKHVFRVYKEGSDAASVASEAALAAFSSPAAQSDAPSEISEEHHSAAEAVPGAPVGAEAFEYTPADSEPTDTGSFDTSHSDSAALSFEPDDLQGVGSEHVPAAVVEPAAPATDIDFSNFDFGAINSEPDSTSQPSVPVDTFTGTDAAYPVHKEAPQGLDFSDDDMFGAVVQPAPEEQGDAISFDFDGDSFADSMDMGGQDSRGKSGTLFSLDAPADAPFNLGEIDFGDELTSVAVQQVNPEDLKPSQEILFAPLAEAQGKTADADVTRPVSEEDSAAIQQELPPLSISSRRKQSPLFVALIAVIAMLVISVLGYLGYSSLSVPKETAAPETGQISVQAVKAAFIDNDSAGELLVITGEAHNEYAKPRAALQIKVTVFDATGQSIATKSAYCGNPLTEGQLSSLPFDKIEAAMANQFGDSLTNMEVSPGKAIPCVVVLSNLPKGAKNFSVQSAGSTVATGRQQ